MDNILSTIIGAMGGGLVVLDILPYHSELHSLKENNPYAGARLGQIAMGTSLYNLQRGLNELRKEMYALSLEVNVKAAALNTTGIDQNTLNSLDYAKNMASNGADWKDFDQKMAAIAVGAPPEFKSKLAEVQTLAVYNLPLSR